MLTTSALPPPTVGRRLCALTLATVRLFGRVGKVGFHLAHALAELGQFLFQPGDLRTELTDFLGEGLHTRFAECRLFGRRLDVDTLARMADEYLAVLQLSHCPAHDRLGLAVVLFQVRSGGNHRSHAEVAGRNPG